MIAASRDRAGVCRLLIDAGANVAAMDDTGRDAFAIARAAGASAAAETIAACTAMAEAPFDEPKDIGPHESASDEPIEDRRTPDRVPVGQDGSAARAVHVFHHFGDQLQPAPSPKLSHHFASPDFESSSRTDVAPNALAGGVRRPEDAATSGIAPGRGNEAPANEQSVFGDWEPERRSEPTTDNPALALADAARQRRIDEHEPIDKSAAWDDFKADLPKFAKPIPRANDEDFRAALRRLMLLASREGSVPRIAIEDALSARGDAEERDLGAEGALLVALGDMGAEIDERLELPVGDDSFKLFVEPRETAAEEREVDEALAFFEDLRSGRNDPLRIYLRSINQKALLTAEREGKLARAMEDAVARALESLSRWPAGLGCLLALVAGAESSPALLWPIVATAREEVATDSEAEAPDDNSDEPAADAELPSDLEVAASLEECVAAADPIATFARIRELAGGHPVVRPNVSASIAAQLGALAFRRPFLARLADANQTDQCADAQAYRQAIADLLSNRDEMARANLRLVYATARRYLNSGVPLDDLIQEGNIGLIKAVDRFDWRRGFKFSTMATWWIKQQIGRSIPDCGFDIRIPVHVHEKTSRLRWQAESFERSNGRSPTLAESAAMLGVSLAKMELIARPGSEPLSVEVAEALGGFEADALTDPFEIVAAREVAVLLDAKLSKLRRKQAEVVRLRFGIANIEVRTLDQIGTTFDLTRERIRQIEAKALRILSSTRAREELGRDIGYPIRGKKQEEASEPHTEGELDTEEAVATSVPVAKNQDKRPGQEITIPGDLSNPAALPSSINRQFDTPRGLERDCRP